MSFEALNNYESATIHFKDGTNVLGLAKIIQGDKIKFKVAKDSKADIWTDLMVQGITFHSKFEDFEYEYIYTKKAYPILARVLEEDAMTLYAKSDSYWIPMSFNKGSGFPTAPATHKTTIVFFVKRRHETTVTTFGLWFKKRAKAYFKDCIGVVEKIDSGEFNSYTIPEMVYYYNDFCGK